MQSLASHHGAGPPPTVLMGRRRKSDSEGSWPACPAPRCRTLNTDHVSTGLSSAVAPKAPSAPRGVGPGEDALFSTPVGISRLCHPNGFNFSHSKGPFTGLLHPAENYMVQIQLWRGHNALQAGPDIFKTSVPEERLCTWCCTWWLSPQCSFCGTSPSSDRDPIVPEPSGAQCHRIRPWPRSWLGKAAQCSP